MIEARTEDPPEYHSDDIKGILIFAPPLYPHLYVSDGVLEDYCKRIRRLSHKLAKEEL